MKKFLFATLLLTLVGCQARIESQLEVRDGALAGRIHVEFTEEAAGLDDADIADITALVSERLPNAKVTVDRGATTSIEIDDEIVALSSQSAITGLKSAGVRVLDDGSVVVQCEMASPSELIAAISKAAAGETDAGALTLSALGSTSVGVYVRIGDVQRATFTLSDKTVIDAPHDDQGAWWSYDIAQPRPGTLIVEGREVEGAGLNLFALGGFIALVTLILAGVFRSRR